MAGLGAPHPAPAALRTGTGHRPLKPHGKPTSPELCVGYSHGRKRREIKKLPGPGICQSLSSAVLRSFPLNLGNLRLREVK